MVFEALQRYVKMNGVSLPTVLVMEEAHMFIKRYRDDFENQDASTVCCRVSNESHERVGSSGSVWSCPLKDHQSFLRPFCPNAIHFFYIGLAMNETRNSSIGSSPTITGGFSASYLHCPRRPQSF